MSRDDYYREMLENYYDTEDDEATSKKIVAGSMIEAVENQLNDHNPEFVTEVFLSLQRKGCNRKQARTVIASVLMEEMYYVLKGKREYDEKKYESALKKRNRTMTNMISVPDVTLAVEDEINDACREIWGAIAENNEAEAAALFLGIWPVIKEYVIHNLYRDTAAGIEKPDLTDVSVMTDYNMEFDALCCRKWGWFCAMRGSMRVQLLLVKRCWNYLAGSVQSQIPIKMISDRHWRIWEKRTKVMPGIRAGWKKNRITEIV